MDFLKAAGGILSTIAPTIASAMGGPLAGMATSAVIGALGLAPDTTSDNVMKAVAGATPEQLLKIKEVENQFILDMTKLEVNVKELQFKDTDSARNREIATHDKTPKILATLIFGLYIGVMYFIFAGHVIEPAMRELALRSLGTLDAALALILGYYFGSSAGSAAKNAHITSLLETKK